MVNGEPCTSKMFMEQVRMNYIFKMWYFWPYIDANRTRISRKARTVAVVLCRHPLCWQIHPMSPCVDTFQPKIGKNTQSPHVFTCLISIQKIRICGQKLSPNVTQLLFSVGNFGHGKTSGSKPLLFSANPALLPHFTLIWRFGILGALVVPLTNKWRNGFEMVLRFAQNCFHLPFSNIWHFQVI